MNTSTNWHRAISAVEAKLAHLIDELGEEIEAKYFLAGQWG